jgi:hypothetical protein
MQKHTASPAASRDGGAGLQAPQQLAAHKRYDSHFGLMRRTGGTTSPSASCGAHAVRQALQPLAAHKRYEKPFSLLPRTGGTASTSASCGAQAVREALQPLPPYRRYDKRFGLVYDRTMPRDIQPLEGQGGNNYGRNYFRDRTANP